MSYSTVAEIQQSNSLMLRVTAAVAVEATDDSNTQFVQQWTVERSWDIAATPGWTGKWESAIAGGIADPGANEGVITDGDILARVQPLLAQYPVPEVPV